MADPFPGEHRPGLFACASCRAPTRPVLRLVDPAGARVTLNDSGSLWYTPATIVAVDQHCDNCGRSTLVDVSVPCDPFFWPYQRVEFDLQELG